MNWTIAVAGTALLAAFGAGLYMTDLPEPAVAVAEPAAVARADGTATTLDALDRETLHAEIRGYILGNPDIIMEAVALLENRRVADAAAAERQMLRELQAEIWDDGFSWVGGNPDGDITLVEFLDYQCGFCKRAHDGVMGMVADDGNIRLIVKEYPILGPVSESASRATLAVLADQGDALYEAFGDALMRFPGRLDDVQIDRIAERSGVDVVAMRARMDDRDISEQIARNRELARRLEITGTPTFILDETFIRGFLPREEMEEAVRLARSAAR